eukprot:3536230-Pyramimonas_sp.AAC.2
MPLRPLENAILFPAIWGRHVSVSSPSLRASELTAHTPSHPLTPPACHPLRAAARPGSSGSPSSTRSSCGSELMPSACELTPSAGELTPFVAAACPGSR